MAVTWTAALTLTNHIPVITAKDQVVAASGTIAASSLIGSVTDQDKNTISYFDFWDSGSAGGYFILNGVRQDAGKWITVSAADLGKLVYVGGSGAGKESIYMAAWDGYAWSNVTSSLITTQAPVNHAAVVTANSQTVAANGTILASSLIASVTDQDKDAISSYRFVDSGAAGGYFVLNGVKQAAGVPITVSAADLGKLVYVGGSGAGYETVSIAAFDGKVWSNYASTTVTTQPPANHAAVVTTKDQLIGAGGSIQASTLIASVVDQDKDVITSYRFLDNGAGGGYFVFNGVKQAAGVPITVSAADLGKLVYVGGSGAGSESVSIAAFDGKTWSSYAAANVATSASKTPWVGQLKDGLLSADVVGAVADGTIDYNEMLKILNDVKAGGVTANEFSDLKTIMSNWNNGVTMSSYVHDISNKLICGDAANANWHGGSTTKTALGNLTSGSSADQMDKLIQKWFLGGDLPGSNYTYAKNTNALFGASGAPGVKDINQGNLGDCYLLSAMADVAAMEPNVIKSMFRDNGNQTWGVRFYINGQEDWVTVNNSLINGYNSSTNIWSTLVEKAYVQLNESNVLGRSSSENAYKAIEGGWATPITQITGRSLTDYYTPNYSASSWNNLKQTFIDALSQGREVWIGSYNNMNVSGKATFYSSHAYSVLGYDNSTGNFIVRNPWGRESGPDNSSHWISATSGGYWTQFEASMTDLYNDRALVSVAGAKAASITSAATGTKAAAGSGAGDASSAGAVPTTTLNYYDTVGLGNTGGVDGLVDQNQNNQRNAMLAGAGSKLI